MKYFFAAVLIIMMFLAGCQAAGLPILIACPYSGKVGLNPKGVYVEMSNSEFNQLGCVACHALLTQYP